MRTLIALALLVCACGPARPPGAAPNVCVRTINGDVQVPKQQAADILVVVDNSGSMAEEQANLKNNFLNANPPGCFADGDASDCECPLQDLANIPPDFKNPAPELYTGTGPLAKCGFVQLVAAFDNDFRIGVITTDVGLCDNRISAAQGGTAWGYRPQRGCLHGDGPPDSGERKVIARADLVDDDTTNDDLAGRFGATLDNIGTFGSPIERGLDAMNIFLDPASDRNPSCAGDLEQFRRADASLVVIFLSDENDCSHSLGGATFGNENAGEVCGEFPNGLTSIPGSKCYAQPDTLSPIDAYIAPLLAADPKAKIAVIAGADAQSNAAGCVVGGDGLPAAGDSVCFQSGGLSNVNGPGPNQVCGPDTAAARGGLPCCTADAGTRYFDFASKIGRRATSSICDSSFRQTMLQIAAFIAAVDFVELAEPPDDPNAIIVEVTKADGTTTVLAALDPTADCANTDGYLLEEQTHIKLCGNARPGPGENLVIRARGNATSVACNAPFFEASGGGGNCASTGASTSMCAAFAAFVLAAACVRVRARRRAR